MVWNIYPIKCVVKQPPPWNEVKYNKVVKCLRQFRYMYIRQVLKSGEIYIKHGVSIL